MARTDRVNRVGAILLVALLVGGSGAYAADTTVGPSVSPSDAPDPADAAALAMAEGAWAMDPDEREAMLARAGAELELDVAEQSGLAEALGGRDAARAALAQAWAPTISTVTASPGDAQPAIASTTRTPDDGYLSPP